MLGFYLDAGDPLVGDLFDPYVWDEGGIKEYLKRYVHCNDYGADLVLLLIQYFVEGKFTDHLPEKPRLSNYSNKNKDIAVAFPVTRVKFHDVSDRERRQFIVDTNLQAIDMVEGRLGKRKLDIDFDRLRQDVKKAAKAYLAESR